MTIQSAFYRGHIEHRRFTPVANSFSYGVSYFYLDLDEIPKLFKIPLLFTYNRPGLFSFWRKDYIGLETESIKESVQKMILSKTGQHFQGSIRLLTNISYLGYCCNPVSFYYCYENENLKFVVSEITNTPWGEKHQQVFSISKEIETFRFPKEFHVSPFMPMTIDYTWVFRNPDEKISIFMQDRQTGGSDVIFDSTLEIKRLPFNQTNLVKTLLKYPLMTFKTALAIYYQALKLYIKKTPFYDHPPKEQVYDNSTTT